MKKDKDFKDLAITFPESKRFYHLDNNGTLNSHSLLSQPRLILKEKETISLKKPSLKFVTDNNQIFYLSINNKPSIVLKNDFISINEGEIGHKDWETALHLNGNWISQSIQPSKPGEWLSLVKGSFKSQIMTPVTSYLVVENEAQKAMLKKKQEQVLSSNKSFDLGEDAQRMSEPNWLILMLLMGVLYFFNERRKRRKQIV